MDALTRHNQKRWDELVANNVRYSRPALDLDTETARLLVDPEGMMGRCQGRQVLCLAGGGGQQSAAYALLGAEVTVLDFCQEQLERDRLTADHYELSVLTVLGDMRDLSCFDASSFDIVHHAHSINFIPDPDKVFREVARVLRTDGLYRISFTNPFVHGTWEDDWDGNGYPLHKTYADGEVLSSDPNWYITDENGDEIAVEGPREFRHTLGTLFNELTARGFVVLGFWEDSLGDPDAEPGTWEHFNTVAAPWLTMWLRLNPRAFLPGQEPPRK
ncbi:MAG: class I SAM-dependent methyltransferase [Lentisphaeria bacterium]|nr:class I SAM-dependent methyltransferase [Lentisphaeria bacterium]